VWNDEGIERFNELLEEVHKDRRSARGKKAEEKFQRTKKSAGGAGNRKWRKIVQESRVRAMNDFEEEDMSDTDSSDEDNDDEPRDITGV
jgi:hypothetical protein